MERQELENLFAKASRIDKAKAGYHTPEEWNGMIKLDGAKRFKRRALGLCGWTSVRNLDEMAQLLYSTGVVSSLDEGREITPSLVGREVSYGLYKSIGFSEVENSKGEKKYRIWAYDFSL